VVLVCLQTTASPEEELLQVHVRARAITCPIFQCFVCLCEIMSANCQSSCISRHSYMHNHASYMCMHLIKLSCYAYASAFSILILISIKINHVNFKFLLLMTNAYCHVNFKVQQSCSNIPFKFKLLQLCPSNSVHFQIQFVSAKRPSSKFASKNSLYLSICFCYRSSSKFTSKNSLYLSF